MYVPRTKAFPKNTEVEVILTFTRAASRASVEQRGRFRGRQRLAAAVDARRLRMTSFTQVPSPALPRMLMLSHYESTIPLPSFPVRAISPVDLIRAAVTFRSAMSTTARHRRPGAATDHSTSPHQKGSCCRR